MPSERAAFLVVNQETHEEVRVTFETLKDSDIAHPSRTTTFDVLIEDFEEGLANGDWTNVTSMPTSLETPLTDLQKSLIHRACNTEINLLNRLYGVNKEGGTVIGYKPVGFKDQVAALESVLEIM